MSAHGDGEPTDVLLIEDNPGDIRLTQEAFKQGKIANTLYVVTDGVEAMDFLAQRDRYADVPSPDVILLDLNLPRKDGHQVLEELQGGSKLRQIQVTILTSSESETDIVNSYDHNAATYIVKPVNPDDFIEGDGELISSNTDVLWEDGEAPQPIRSPAFAIGTRGGLGRSLPRRTVRQLAGRKIIDGAENRLDMECGPNGRVHGPDVRPGLLLRAPG